MNQSLFFCLPGAFRFSLKWIFAVVITFNLPFSAFSQPVLSWTTSSYNGFGTSCHGSSDGFIDLTVTGGQPPYDFLWSNNETTEDISGLPAGFYSVQVIDANADTANALIEITQPDELLVSLQSKTDVSCFGGNDGEIQINVTGGTTPYGFLWSNGAVTQNINTLTAGTYTLTITDDNGCTENFTETISEPAALTAALQSKTDVSCFGGNDGEIQINVTGGTTPYGFLWSNGAVTQNINTLTAGTYTLTITDDNGCTENFTETISEPAALTAALQSKTDVSCFGGNDGEIQINVTGGTTPYGFLWSNGAVTQNINTLTAGTYTLTITDDNGCTENFTETISEPSALTAALQSKTDVSCFGGNDGEIQINVTGGTTPYGFLWSNGAVTQNINTLTAGTYTLTITDDNGCTENFTETISEPSALTAALQSKTDVSCFGGNDGEIQINVTGGTTPYGFLWSNGAVTQNINTLTAGTYTLTITDDNGCTENFTETISEPAALTAALQSKTDVSCFGGNDGEIQINVTGGTTPYGFLWSNGAVTQNINTLTAGTYTLTITDDNGCTENFTETISEPAALTAALQSKTDVSCFGGNDGEIQINVTGGTTPYGFLWSNGAVTQNINTLTAGTYTLTITDDNGCTEDFTETISEPSALTAALQSKTDVSCFGGNDGEIQINVTGGTTPYGFLWSNGAVTQNINTLTAGTYTLTITDDNGCTENFTETISEPSALTAALQSKTDVSCFGGNDGEIQINVTGGTTPYGFLWSNGAVTQNINTLTAGTYTLTITDDNGCTENFTETISEPSALTAALQSKTDVSCFGGNDGEIQINVTGGTTPYGFLWSNGAVTQNINTLTAGTYTLTITDDNGCTENFTETISEPAALTAALQSKTDVSCFGGNDGEIQINVTGGTTPYGFLWSNGAVTQNINTLTAGTYTLTITDDNGCTVNFTDSLVQPDSIQIGFLITPANGGANGIIQSDVVGGVPPYGYLWSNNATTSIISNLLPGIYTLTVSDDHSCQNNKSGFVPNAGTCTVTIDSITDASCFGFSNGAVYITVQGAITPDFLWSNGSISEDLIAAPAGTYTVTVTDNFGCNLTASATINEPQLLTVDLTVTHTTCGLNNGSITASGVGGTPGYSYLWSNGGLTSTIGSLAPSLYVVTVTDANGCTATGSATVNASSSPVAVIDSVTNVDCFGASTGAIYISVSSGTQPYTYLWSNGSATEDLIAVPAGTYTVTVTDFNGCTVTASSVITQPSAPLSVSLTPVNSTCGNANGSIAAAPSGGTPNYSFLWSNGQTAATAVNLAAGTYTVTVTDSKGCTVSAQSTLTTTPNPGIQLDSVVNVKCFGQSTGAVYISITTNPAGLSYQWSDGSSLQDLINVPAGIYTVTVTDSLNCFSVFSATISEPALLQDSITTVNATCNNSNGSATVWPYGGTSPYSFLWSTGAVTSTISGVAAGTYTVTVTDNLGCTLISTASINNTGGPVITIDSVRNVSCFGGSNGGIYTTVTGGTLPYIVKIWSNNATNVDSISNLTAGNYTFIVIDANNCLYSITQTVTQPLPLNATAQLNNPTCLNSNGSIQVFPNGGTPGYSFLWNTGATTALISGLSAGNYTVTITDSNSCSVIKNYTLTTNGNPVITLDSIVNVKCFGQNTGGIFISVSSGTPPYTYQWSDGFTGQDNTSLLAGVYTVTVTDNNGCTAIQSFTVIQPSVLSVSINTTQSTCGLPNGTASAITSGGSPPMVSYLWAPGGQTTPVISGLSPGVYTVTVTDNNGCTASGSGTVITPGNPVIILDSLVNVTCNGFNNGIIAITPSGGSPGYSVLWIPGGQTDTIIQGLSPGNYTVIVTDAQNCTAQQTYSITQPAVLNNSFNITHETCSNANGALTALPTGGTSPYSFLWSNGLTSQTITGLSAGPFTVTITDSKGCTKISSVTIINSPGPSITTDTIIDVSCNGFADGEIQILISGGTTPFSFLWSTLDTVQNINGLTAGIYQVTVTDANSCTATASFTVNEPDALADSLVITDANCGLNNGSVTVFPYGGNGGYSFLWNNLSNQQTITGLNAGVYIVTITDSKGCSVSDTAVVTNDQPLSLTVDQLFEPLCFGDTTGLLCISVSGGLSPYSFVWSTGDTVNCITSLAAGVYTVTVTDGNTCSLTQSFTISQPSQLVIDSIQISNATCNNANGSATVFASGGTAPFSYQWSTSANDTLLTVTNLSAGVYTVTVTDANGCTKVNSATISDAGIPFIQTFSILDVKCNGGNDGSITVNPSGGTPPYSFQWSTSATDTLSTVSNLTAGNFTVTITDANGCIFAQSFTVNEPDALQDSVQTVNPTCGSANGSIIVFPFGGTVPYSYLWSTSPTDTLNSIFNYPAGVYTVTITDANGCSQIQSVTLTDPGNPVAIVSGVQNVSCFGGSDGAVFVNVTGGNPPYQFAWSNNTFNQNLINVPAQTYTLTVTDSEGCITILTETVNEPSQIQLSFIINPASCNLSNGSATVVASGGTPGYTYLWSTLTTDSIITGVPAGIYTITVTDNNGCTVDSVISISNPASPVIVSGTINNVLCHGESSGSIFPVVQGGTLPLSFAWSSSPADTLLNLINIPAGVYTLTVTDAANCTATSTYQVTEPAAIQTNFNITPATCGANNGEVQVFVTGGTGSYTYLWSNNSTAALITSIAAGVYTVTITDGNNCTVTSTALVSNLDGPQVSVVDSANVTCPGGSNGSIQIQITGGTFPYTIQWSNGQTGTVISNLPGNTVYTVTVTDSNSCISFLTVFIDEPDAIQSNAVVSQLNGIYNISCFEEEDGYILLNPQGGTPPYTFIWSNISFNQNLTNVGVGSYTVTITDSKGCTRAFSFQLTQPPPVVAAATANKLICGTDADTLKAILPAYGTGTWFSVNSGPVILNPDSAITPVSNLSFGNNPFIWVVTDGVCYDTARAFITRNSEIIAIAGADRELCSSSVTLNATPPQFGYGFWQLVSGSGIILDTSKAQTQVVGLAQGPNVFKWTVINGSCTDDALITITVLPEENCRETLQIPSGFTPNGDGYNDVFFIKGLDDYPENSLVIYNRWGNKVYEQSPYKNKWKGVNMSNELLPEGTYFYIFTVKAIDKVFKGYIDIRR